MPLSIQQRNTYLHAMGIQPWRVRDAADIEVDVAVEDVKIEKAFTPELVAAEAITQIKPAAVANISAPAFDAAFKTALNKPNESAARHAAEVVASVTKTNALETPVFRLGFVAFADVLVVTDLTLRETDTINTEQLRLICALRTAMGFAEQSVPQSMLLAWPMVANSKMDQSEAIAFDAVQAQFKKQLQKYKPRYTLLMGETAARYILGLDLNFEQTRGQLVANETLLAAVTVSVNELLKIHALKLAAWQDLQVIRQS